MKELLVKANAFLTAWLNKKDEQGKDATKVTLDGQELTSTDLKQLIEGAEKTEKIEAELKEEKAAHVITKADLDKEKQAHSTVIEEKKKVEAELAEVKANIPNTQGNGKTEQADKPDAGAETQKEFETSIDRKRAEKKRLEEEAAGVKK